MAPGQDWCLQCGAGAPGSIGTPGWRSGATILTVAIVLVLGAAAAAYAALSKGTPATHMVTTTVAQVTTPATTTPQATTPTTAAPTTTTPLPLSKVKTPKIPLTATNVPKATNTTTTPTKTTPTNTTTTPSNSATGGSSTEPEATAVVLDTDAATTYNPYSLPPAEFGDPSLTIDGDTSTAWTAQVAAASAPKMDEGVLLDLKAKQKVSELELITSTPGITVQVFGATTQTAPSSITDPAWVRLSHSRVISKKHTLILLKHSSTAFTFVTLWISKAPASSTPTAPGRVAVNEIELFPTK
jgi:hypothetical protein